MTYDPKPDFKAIKNALTNYSDDQERDENGRFGSGEGAAMEPTHLKEDEYDHLMGGKMTPEEIVAVDSYIGSSFIPNSALRGTLDISGTSFEQSTQDTISRIDSALDKSAGLPHDTILYRGAAPGFYTDMKVGDTFTDKAFLSTATGTEQARAFGTVIAVHAPEGTPAIRGMGREHETILPRGLSFKVTSLGGSNGKLMTVEVQR